VLMLITTIDRLLSILKKGKTVTFEINIKDANDHNTILKVRKTDTIDSIYQSYKQKNNFSSTEKFILNFNNIECSRYKTLANCNITSNTIITATKYFNLTIVDGDGNTSSIDTNDHENISILRRKYADSKNINLDKKTILFFSDNQLLTDNLSLEVIKCIQTSTEGCYLLAVTAISPPQSAPVESSNNLTQITKPKLHYVWHLGTIQPGTSSFTEGVYFKNGLNAQKAYLKTQKNNRDKLDQRGFILNCRIISFNSPPILTPQYLQSENIAPPTILVRLNSIYYYGEDGTVYSVAENDTKLQENIKIAAANVNAQGQNITISKDKHLEVYNYLSPHFAECSNCNLMLTTKVIYDANELQTLQTSGKVPLLIKLIFTIPGTTTHGSIYYALTKNETDATNKLIGLLPNPANIAEFMTIENKLTQIAFNEFKIYVSPVTQTELYDKIKYFHKSNINTNYERPITYYLSAVCVDSTTCIETAVTSREYADYSHDAIVFYPNEKNNAVSASVLGYYKSGDNTFHLNEDENHPEFITFFEQRSMPSIKNEKEMKLFLSSFPDANLIQKDTIVFCETTSEENTVLYTLSIHGPIIGKALVNKWYDIYPKIENFIDSYSWEINPANGPLGGVFYFQKNKMDLLFDDKIKFPSRVHDIYVKHYGTTTTPLEINAEYSYYEIDSQRSTTDIALNFFNSIAEIFKAPRINSSSNLSSNSSSSYTSNPAPGLPSPNPSSSNTTYISTSSSSDTTYINNFNILLGKNISTLFNNPSPPSNNNNCSTSLQNLSNFVPTFTPEVKMKIIANLDFSIPNHQAKYFHYTSKDEILSHNITILLKAAKDNDNHWNAAVYIISLMLFKNKLPQTEHIKQLFLDTISDANGENEFFKNNLAPIYRDKLYQILGITDVGDPKYDPKFIKFKQFVSGNISHFLLETSIDINDHIAIARHSQTLKTYFEPLDQLIPSNSYLARFK